MLLNCGVWEESRVPWTSKRSNQSILREISPEYSLEGLMLKLKLQHFGHLMQRADSLENTLMLGKIEGRRRREWQRMKWLTSLTPLIWVWASSGSWWWTGRLGMLKFRGSKELDMTEWLNWTDRAFTCLAAKNVIILISVLTIWWCPCLLCCWKRVFVFTIAFFWQSSVSLCPFSFCTPKPNLPVTPGVSWLPTFACQSPIK